MRSADGALAEQRRVVVRHGSGATMIRHEMVNVGAQNYVLAHRVVAVLASNTAPVRRVIREGKDSGKLLDVSQHRELRTLIVLDDGHMVASFLPTATVVRRFADPVATVDDQDPPDE
jgi:extracellular matrix regulatory protein A